MNTEKPTHLIRNCPKGSECKQTWESLKSDKYQSLHKQCLKCKETVWEVVKYPIAPFLLEQNCVIAIRYDITNLKKMIDNIGQPIARPKIPKSSDE